MAVALLACTVLRAQDNVEIFLNAASHNSVHPVDGAGARIYDSDHAGDNYSDSIDYWITLIGSCDSPSVFRLVIESLDLRFDQDGLPCEDTLFIYDGPSITSPLLWYATGNYYDPLTYSIYASPSNTAQALTIRFKTSHETKVDPSTGAGFVMLSDCSKPCENITPHIDSIFYKTSNGDIYEFGHVKYLFDTASHMAWDSVLLDSVMVIDTQYFYGVNLCMGDGVIFTGHCDYTYSTGWYHPTDSTTRFFWDMGTTDSIVGIGQTSAFYDKYIS